MTKGKKTKTAFITKYMLGAYQSASAQGGTFWYSFRLRP